MPNNDDILNVTFESVELGETITIRKWLIRLLATLWEDGEQFSAKRPFGQAKWREEIFEALADNGIIDGTRNPDDDGWIIDDRDIEAAEAMILQAIEEEL